MKGRDCGSSLIEAIVGFSLVGAVFVAVLDASWTNTRVSAQTDGSRAQIAAAFIEVERVLRDAEYSPCPHIDGGYLVAIEDSVAFDDRRQLDITRHEYWDTSSSTWIDFGGFTLDQCSHHDDLMNPFAIQRFSVSISEEGGSASTASLVKSRESWL